MNNQGTPDFHTYRAHTNTGAATESADAQRAREMPAHAKFLAAFSEDRESAGSGVSGAVREQTENGSSASARFLDEFHTHRNAHPKTNHPDLRPVLHDEEHSELIEAFATGDALKIARELADVVYVAYGTAWVYGIDLDAALREVHRANMQKMNTGLRRPDGKIVKGHDYRAPDMSIAVRKAAA